MSVLDAKEAIRFFKSYGFRVDEESVKEWVEDKNQKAELTCGSRPIVEEDLYRYNDWCSVKGTAYEEGIDDRTKIARLLEEVTQLKMEVKNLKSEKQRLKNQLGMHDPSCI